MGVLDMGAEQFFSEDLLVWYYANSSLNIGFPDKNKDEFFVERLLNWKLSSLPYALSNSSYSVEIVFLPRILGS